MELRCALDRDSLKLEKKSVGRANRLPAFAGVAKYLLHKIHGRNLSVCTPPSSSGLARLSRRHHPWRSDELPLGSQTQQNDRAQNMAHHIEDRWLWIGLGAPSIFPSENHL